MKFDHIIGNPPYQDETVGDQKTFAPPVYDKFLEESYKIADKVMMIHPARFLYNAGSTPKSWNEKMLNDPHFKVLKHEQDSSKVFPNTDIKGGVAITYRDSGKTYGAIGVYTKYPELNAIIEKVTKHTSFHPFSDIVITRTAYRLTDAMHSDHPEAISQLSKGHAYDMSTNIFERLPQIFHDEQPDDGHKYIRIYGRERNARAYKYIRTDYVNEVVNLYKWKIFVPKSNGTGELGETMTMPVIGEPGTGNTESFISIGICDTREESEAVMQYVRTKFARCMLGVLKATQDNPPEKWAYVPLQDFSSRSDIDWLEPTEEIDRQLYAKYRLTKEEIAFMESHGKEMN